MRRFFVIPAFFVFFAGIVDAQVPFLEKLTVDDGLSQGFVSSIAQDDDGFLWFGTKNGLNRYDGYGFQVFRNDPFDSLSLVNNQVFRLAAAGDFLFFATEALDLFALPESQGAGFFHRKTNRFFKIPGLDASYIRTIFLTGERTLCALLLSEKGAEIKFIRWPADLAERENPSAHFEIKTEPNLPKNLWAAQLSADKKRLLLLAADRILVRDLEKSTTVETPLPASFSQLLPKNGLNLHHCDIWESPDGAVWAFANGVFGRFGEGVWQIVRPPFQSDYLMAVDQKKGVAWFRTTEGPVQIDFQKKPFDGRPIQKLPIEQRLMSGLIDNFGNVWFGTDAHGIRKFSPRTALFKNYLDGFSVYCPPVFNGKNHVALTDLRPNYWEGKLLDLRTGATQDLENFRRIKKAGGRLFSCATENGFFWTLNNEGNNVESVLMRIDPETGRAENFPIPVEIELRTTILGSATADEIWIINPSQLLRFDQKSGQFSVFKNENTETAEARAAQRAPDGTWWIGTTTGLIRAEPDGAGGFRFSKMTVEKGNRNSLATNSIKSLLLDPADQNVLWIGTDGQGMSRFDIKKGQFQHFSTKNGLPDDVVYGILADDEKPRKLWISTNRGLARFSPEAGLFQYFTKTDGLPDNEFNTFASFRSPDGQLFFGTVNGLTRFFPKDLTADSRPPAVRFSGLKINGQPVLAGGVLAENIAFSKAIELPFSKNNLELSFAAMDFTAPERNQFAYYLRGAEAEWAHRGFGNSAQYLNLAPGDYEFFVKAANSNGIWNDAPISIKIRIAPPFYRSWLAWLFYVGLVGSGLFYLYKMKVREKLEHAEAERLKSLDAFKSRFFTNITHEFRTPLTVILGMTDRLEKGERDAARKNQHGLVRRSSENLLRLITQLLDLAKLEASELKMNYVQGDVLAFLRYVSESLHSLANAQNVLMRVESNRSKIVMDYDPERLLQVVHNLLSNAIKFTPSGGKIILRADFDEKWLQISVTDTGVGIERDDLPRLFDRFFQAENQQKGNGSGIGLSLTKELVQAMGGSISVESATSGGGTTFFVRLPATSVAAFEKETAHFADENGAERAEKRSFLADLENRSSAADDSLLHVLLIEDNLDVVEYLAACLGKKYRLDFAFNGRLGIEKALETVPDLIVSDVMMPEKDGFEVCEFLKNDPRTSHVPIILLTARAGIEDRIAGLQRGADAYLEKPFQEKELLVWVEQLIAQRKRITDYGLRIADWPTTQLPPDSSGSRENSQSALRNPDSAIDMEAAFLEKMRVILEANFADPDFSADALCAKMEMPRIPLHRKLHALTGRAIVEQINFFRLEKGRAILLEGEANVSEAAFQVGFNDPKYFTRLFRKTYGFVPKALRKRGE